MLAFSFISPSAFTSRHGLSLSPSSLTTSPCKRIPNHCTISMSLDPHSVHQLSHHAHTAVTHLLSHHSSASTLDSISNILADATATLSGTAAAISNTASTATDATVEAVTQPGLWDKFVHTIELAIKVIHSTLVNANIPGAYGLSIVLFTFIVKAITFPLNFKQMESTMKMQAMQPKIKKIQADYKDNPTVMQQMTAELYKKQNVNPLAGCFPVFAQIPIWVALYRSVLNLASENQLNESFLWLPSLQGPVTSTGQGLDTWLFPLVNGAPPIGWHDALCYLTVPVILMANQYYTTKLVTPPATDSQQAQANNVLKFMPLLIGFFSLNVPSGLGVYWVTNNFLSTVQTIYIRSKVDPSSLEVADDADGDVIDVKSSEGFSSNGSVDTPSATTKAIKGSKNKKRRKRR